MLTQTYTKIPWFFASFCLRWRVRPLLIRFVSSRGHFNSSSFSLLLPFQFLCLRQFVFDVDLLILFYAPHVEKKSSTFFGGDVNQFVFGNRTIVWTSFCCTSNLFFDLQSSFVGRQICCSTSKTFLLDVKICCLTSKAFLKSSKRLKSIKHWHRNFFLMTSCVFAMN